MSWRVAVYFVLFCSACDGCHRFAEGTSSTNHHEAPISAELPRQITSSPQDESPQHEVGNCPQIGFVDVPTFPERNLVEQNKEALENHQAGRFDDALRGFSQVLAAKPDYDAVRFNRACALSKLRRFDEAREEIMTLLCRDLPTYAEKVRNDPDLSSFRETFPMESTLVELANRYREVVDQGVSLVAYQHKVWRNEENENLPVTNVSWTQSGVWLHRQTRFVPMGPRVSRLKMYEDSAEWEVEGRPLEIASIFDSELYQVLSVSYLGSYAEDPMLEGIRVAVFSIPLGEQQIRAYLPADGYFSIGLLPEGILVKRQYDPTLLIDAQGRARSRKSLPQRYLGVYPTSWRIEEQSTPFMVRQKKLILPDGETIDLNLPGRDDPLNRIVRANEERNIVAVLSGSSGDCEEPNGFFAVTVVNLEEKRVHRVLAEEGQAVIEIGAEGALYLDLPGELRRYANPFVDRYETLPAGIGLSASPWSFNPGC